MSRPRVVAIDGAAGSGKSTLARGLARRLALPYVNTGLMYRAAAAASIAATVDADDAERLADLAASLRFTLAGTDPPRLEVEGWPIADLTTLEVEAVVSAVARHPGVRAALRARQRELGLGGAVMEGRDIGAVVFPDAPVKLFLVAGPRERAERRAEERGLDEGALERVLHGRDASDARTSPLVPAVGAVVIDTGALGIERTLEEAVRIVLELAPELTP